MFAPFKLGMCCREGWCSQTSVHFPRVKKSLQIFIYYMENGNKKSQWDVLDL